MLELKGISGVFYGMSEWIMRFSGINLLWFGMSLPFLLLFVTVEMSSPAGLVFFGAAAWLSASFLFFPATAAVFSVIRDWVVEEDYSSIVKKFFGQLKSDYKMNVKAGGFLSVIWLAWYYGSFYSFAEKNGGAMVFLILGIALFIYTMNFLSINAHYHMDGKQKLINAFFLSAGRPFMGLFIAASSFALLWISTAQLVWLLPLIACSMTAFLSFTAFYRTAQKIEGKLAADDAV